MAAWTAGTIRRHCQECSFEAPPKDVWREAPGLVRGPFGIFKETEFGSGRSWNVTHLPTGLLVRYCRSKRIAQRLVVNLLRSGVDWANYEARPGYFEKLPEDVRVKVQHALAAALEAE